MSCRTAGRRSAFGSIGFVAARDSVRVCAFTGTPSRKSIMNYWHHLCWCLREGAPVPLSETEATEWGLALR
jgi:hypothetical protein